MGGRGAAKREVFVDRPPHAKSHAAPAEDMRAGNIS